MTDPVETRKLVEDAAIQRCEFLLAREAEVRRRDAELKEWFKLRNILEVKYGEDFPSGDIIIRVIRSKAINTNSIEDACEVTP